MNRSFVLRKEKVPALTIVDRESGAEFEFLPDSELATTSALRNFARELVKQGGRFDGENRIGATLVYKDNVGGMETAGYSFTPVPGPRYGSKEFYRELARRQPKVGKDAPKCIARGSQK